MQEPRGQQSVIGEFQSATCWPRGQRFVVDAYVPGKTNITTAFEAWMVPPDDVTGSTVVGAPAKRGQRLHALRAFGYSVPIGMLGGLIGLGGAEFRLPVLAGPLGYPATLETRMAKLALSFPCMKGKAGVCDAFPPWDAEGVDQWAAGDGASHGERATAQFLLAVWNPNHSWRSGKFDMMEALQIWDTSHHTAFLRWIERPWWG